MSTRRCSSPTALRCYPGARRACCAPSRPACRAPATASPRASCRASSNCATSSSQCCWGARMHRWLGAATVLALLGLLEAFVRAGKVNAMLVPPPTAIARRTYDIIASGTFLQPLAQTLYLLFTAYFAASALAIIFGLLMGRFRAVHHLFEPVVESLRPLPKVALLPPLIMLLGLGDAMKLTIVGLAVFFPVLINTIQGVRGVD